MTTLFAMDLKKGDILNGGQYILFDSNGTLLRKGGHASTAGMPSRKEYIEAYSKGRISAFGASHPTVTSISKPVQSIIKKYGTEWTLDYCHEDDLLEASPEFQKAYILMKMLNPW